MHRFRQLSVTEQTINAQLYEHERILNDRSDVGLYDGKEKTVAFDNGRLYLTSHRLIYVDAANPRRNSRSLDLALVKQTEQWVGFMKSSPKITLVLSSAESSQEVGGSGAEAMRYAPNVEGGAPVLAGAPERGGPATAAETWNCHVCGFRNLSTGSGKCTLCGVVRSLDAPSKRSSRPGTPTLSAAPAPAPPASPAMEGGLVSCPACTFLNHPSMVRCEVCESPLTPGTSGASSRPSTPVAVSASGPRPATPQPLSTGAGTPPSVRLSFRRGGDKAFYAALKTALKAKAWESEADRRSSRRPAVIATTAGPSGSGGISAASGGEIDTASGHRMTTFGINGILRTIDLDARDRDEDMQEALSDLEALMARAREMVNLAQSLSAKMADSTTESASGAIGGKMDSSEETTVRKSLISLGLATPAFTLEMAQDEKDYHLSLAKELGSVLLGRPTGSAQRPSTEPLMVDAKGRKGIIGLDEIWCLWNRARGVALVAPKDLKSACEYLPSVTRPELRLRTFASGLTVLHTPYFSEAAFLCRLVSALNPKMQQQTDGVDLPSQAAEVPALSNLEIAQIEGISVLLAQQMVESLEGAPQEGTMPALVRDEGDTRQGTRWMLNQFEQLEESWADVN